MKAVTLALLVWCLVMAEAARSRKEWSGGGGLRRAASGVYQSLSSMFGEDNIKALYKVHNALYYRRTWCVLLLCTRTPNVQDVHTCGFSGLQGRHDTDAVISIPIPGVSRFPITT